MTWPHTNIIGGLLSVDCSLDTGHTNTEWKAKPLGKGISMGNSLDDPQTLPRSLKMRPTLVNRGSAIAPAVTAM